MSTMTRFIRWFWSIVDPMVATRYQAGIDKANEQRRKGLR